MTFLKSYDKLLLDEVIFAKELEEQVDWQSISDGKPLIVEIGCGNGHFLVDQAAKQPASHFVGIDQKGKRLIRCREKQTKRGLTNITWILGEGLAAVSNLFSDASISGVYLLFNDPWPKKRHHKRRLTQKPFMDQIYLKLKKNGWFYFVTDHREFYEWTLELSGKDKRFELNVLDSLDEFMQTLFAVKWQQEQRSFYGFRLDKSSP